MPRTNIAETIQRYMFYGFCALVALVPWCYGATPFNIALVLAQALLVVGVPLLLVGLFSGHHRKISRIPVLLVFPILVQGWFMVINAKGVFDSGFWEMMPLTQTWPGWPGTVDKTFSYDLMIRFTSLVVVFLCAVHIGSQPDRTKRILCMLAISVTLLALLGLVQRAAGAHDIFFGERRISKYFFATFMYHANAGAFFNLYWPVIAGFFFLSLGKRKSNLRDKLFLQFWSFALVITTLALFVHGSRAASLLAFGMIPAWFWIQRRHSAVLHSIPKAVRFTLVFFGIFLFSALCISIVSKTGNRWLYILENTRTLERRFNAYEASLPMIADGGFAGWGPGSFKWMFPSYGGSVTEELSGFWRFLHQDYLQTLIEWGWLGSCFWALLVFFSLFQLALRCRNVQRSSRTLRMLSRAMLLGVSAVGIHAAIDFPFQIYSIQLLTFLFLGLAWGIPLKESSYRSRSL